MNKGSFVSVLVLLLDLRGYCSGLEKTHAPLHHGRVACPRYQRYLENLKPSTEFCTFKPSFRSRPFTPVWTQVSTDNPHQIYT